MKVTMLRTLAGPAGTAVPGTVLNLPDAQSKLLTEGSEPAARKATQKDEEQARRRGLLGMQKYTRGDDE